MNINQTITLNQIDAAVEAMLLGRTPEQDNPPVELTREEMEFLDDFDLDNFELMPLDLMPVTINPRPWTSTNLEQTT